MAEGDTRRIATEAMEEPHIRGRRVTVRQIYALVENEEVDPETVADRYDLDVADVYHALAYYHDNPREMSRIESERMERLEEVEEAIDRPPGVSPDSA